MVASVLSEVIHLAISSWVWTDPSINQEFISSVEDLNQLIDKNTSNAIIFGGINFQVELVLIVEVNLKGGLIMGR